MRAREVGDADGGSRNGGAAHGGEPNVGGRNAGDPRECRIVNGRFQRIQGGIRRSAVVDFLLDDRRQVGQVRHDVGIRGAADHNVGDQRVVERLEPHRLQRGGNGERALQLNPGECALSNAPQIRRQKGGGQSRRGK